MQKFPERSNRSRWHAHHCCHTASHRAEAASSSVCESWITCVQRSHHECMAKQWFKGWQHFIRGQYFIQLVTRYFTQPVSLSWGSFKARISKASLWSYWWRATLERWIIINKMSLSATRMTLIHSTLTGYFSIAVLGQKVSVPTFNTAVWSNEIHLFLICTGVYLRLTGHWLFNDWKLNRHSWVSEVHKRLISVYEVQLDACCILLISPLHSVWCCRIHTV